MPPSFARAASDSSRLNGVEPKGNAQLQKLGIEFVVLGHDRKMIVNQHGQRTFSKVVNAEGTF